MYPKPEQGLSCAQYLVHPQLALGVSAITKNDRYLANTVPQGLRDVRHFELKRIAIRVNRYFIQYRQQLSPIAPETGRRVTHRDSQRQTGKGFA